MKVAVVSPYDLAAPGGVQDQVLGIVRELRELGHEAWAVAPGSGGPEGTRHVGRTVRIPANRSRAPISLSPRTPARVRAAVGTADVVHVHEPLMPMTSLAVLRSADRPAVGTFHADPGILGRGVYRGAVPVLRRLVSKLSLVTAVSETARAAVAGFTEARIIPNAVDVNAFRTAAAERVPQRVVFLGRDEPRKGLDVVLRAWPQVRAVHPDAVLHVIGSVRDVAPPGVAFLGRVSEDRKRSELAEAVVLTAPNLGGESFGIVLIEGMAAGCAVVASDLAAFRAVGGGGVRFVERGDADDLAAAIAGLLSDPGGAAELAAAGSAAVERFDWSNVIAAYTEAYREALAAGG
jgi:phosphatidylinositol alpha-mannosyltransferase